LRESQEEWERRSLLIKRGMNLKWLLEKVAGHFAIDTESLKSGSRAPAMANARAVLCHLGLRKIGLTSVSIANELGISTSAVSRAIARAPEALQRKEIEGEWLEYQ
jgi:chromosomal replication initiation ATPase DnaA